MLDPAQPGIVNHDRGAVAASPGVELDDVGAEPGGDDDALERILAGVARASAVRDDDGHSSATILRGRMFERAMTEVLQVPAEASESPRPRDDPTGSHRRLAVFAEP